MPALPAALGDADAPVLSAASVPHVSRDLQTTNGRTVLDGTLWLPPGEGPFPAVVLVPSPGATAADVEQDALLFVQAGIGAYGYDARPDTAQTGPWRAAPVVADRVGDAVAAVQAVRRVASVDPERVGVWGVGDAGWILPFVGREADVAFLILVNTTALPLAQQQMWDRGQALLDGGAPPSAARASVRGLQVATSAATAATAAERWATAGAQGAPGGAPDRAAGATPDLSPAQALAHTDAPLLALYDGSGSAATGPSADALRRASRGRDQPYDVVSVLDAAPHDLSGTGRSSDAAYRQTVLGWTRTVVSNGAVRAALAPEAVRGMTRGFPPLPGLGTTAGSGALRTVSAPGRAAAGAGLSEPGPLGTGSSGTDAPGTDAPGTGRGAPPLTAGGTTLPDWFRGADRGTPWYATAWFQLPVLLAFLGVFTLGLVASLWPLRGGTRAFGGARAVHGAALRGTTVTAERPPRGGTILRLTQGLLCLVDLGLLAGLVLTVLQLVGVATTPALPNLTNLPETLRTLSAASATLALFLALLLLFAPRTGWRPRRTGVAVSVALAAALFLPFLLYWQVPFLAG